VGLNKEALKKELDTVHGATIEKETIEQLKTEIEPAGTSELFKTEIEPAGTSELFKTEVEPAGTSELFKTEIEPAETVEQLETEIVPAETIEQYKQATIGERKKLKNTTLSWRLTISTLNLITKSMRIASN